MCAGVAPLRRVHVAPERTPWIVTNVHARRIHIYKRTKGTTMANEMPFASIWNATLSLGRGMFSNCQAGSTTCLASDGIATKPKSIVRRLRTRVVVRASEGQLTDIHSAILIPRHGGELFLLAVHVPRHVQYVLV